VALSSWLRNPFRTRQDITEAAPTDLPSATPQRSGFEYGIPTGGLTEYSQGMGAATQTDRKSELQALYDAYLACPWAWAAVNAIARTITAGGLVTDWDGDDGEGDQDVPDKPANVLALERLLSFTNPREDIRQLMRGVVTDLQVFGDAYIEVVWVGNQPVSLYSLDAPTMFPIADAHGTISKYVQLTDFGQRAEFEPRDVIHISMDAPRSGIFGVSPTSAAQIPITAWLYAAATGKEMFRKGLPPALHVDFPKALQPGEINRWTAQHMQRFVGPRNVGFPLVTTGGAQVHELQHGRIADVETYLDQKRDEILAVYGVPPAEAGVIEAGHLGGGTGESQKKTFRVNTCQPIAELILEKINYHIVRMGFGITGWHLKFNDIDFRDSKTIEDIRDQRVRSGQWTLNRARAEIGEPPVEGGDNAVMIDRTTFLIWKDMEQMSTATAASRAAPAVLAGITVPGLELEPKPEPAPASGFGPDDSGTAQDQADANQGPASTESWVHDYRKRLSTDYRERLREALRDLPDLEEAAR
jgi:HK97 family phage portal protein